MRLTTLDLPGVYRIEEASNKAIEKLHRTNIPFRATITVLDEGVLFQPGDVVQIVNANRGVDFPMWVETSVMVSYGRHQITGIAYADQQFSDQAYCDTDLVGKLNNEWLIVDVNIYGCRCDALDDWAQLNAAGNGAFYWPCVGQTTHNGGIWSKAYLDAGGWSASPQPDDTHNLQTGTLPEDFLVNQTVPGTTKPVFCGTGGIIHIDNKSDSYSFSAAESAEFLTTTGGYDSVSASISSMYYQVSTAYSSSGTLGITVDCRVVGSSSFDVIGYATFSNVGGNPAIRAEINSSSFQGALFEMPTDRMSAVTVTLTVTEVQEAYVRLYCICTVAVNGAVVSTANRTISAAQNYAIRNGLQNVYVGPNAYYAHIVLTANNAATNYYNQSQLICTE